MASYALADIDSSGFSLAQNESFLPPSPAALRALAEENPAHALYPDPDWTALRQALASAHGLDPATLLCGAGSMELIAAVVRAFSGPGDSLVASEYSYAFIATACQFAGSTLFSSPENDRTVDVDALLDAVRHDTRIVFVANPGNPTGTRIADAQLTRLRAQLPDNVLLIIDQAYGEFSESVAPGLWPLVDRGDTVITRSFSKAYALAGARVGWCALAPALAEQVRKLLNPNNVSRASQHAAIAALGDTAHLQRLVARTADNRDQFIAQLRHAGFTVADSHTNFVLVPFASVERCESADAKLRAAGLFARGMGGYGLGHCLRVTVADSATLNRVATLLGDLAA